MASCHDSPLACFGQTYMKWPCLYSVLVMNFKSFFFFKHHIIVDNTSSLVIRFTLWTVSWIYLAENPVTDGTRQGRQRQSHCDILLCPEFVHDLSSQCWHQHWNSILTLARTASSGGRCNSCSYIKGQLNMLVLSNTYQGDPSVQCFCFCIKH